MLGNIRLTRRVLVGGSVAVMGHSMLGRSTALAQDNDQIGVFGLPFVDASSHESVLQFDYNESRGWLMYDRDFQFSNILPPAHEAAPIFRISVEGVGDATVDEVRTAALQLGPADATQIGEESWSDGSIYQLFSSASLSSLHPDNPGLWAGHAPGTFGVVLMQKLGKDELSRAVVTLPQARYSVQAVEEQVKPNGRGGFTLRLWVDSTASLESKLIAFERALYEGFAQFPQYVFGVLFAYSEGNPEVASGVTDVGRAAVSIDGKGFSGDESRSFLIQQDEDATLQAAINTALFEEQVFELAK